MEITYVPYCSECDTRLTSAEESRQECYNCIDNAEEEKQDLFCGDCLTPLSECSHGYYLRQEK